MPWRQARWPDGQRCYARRRAPPTALALILAHMLEFGR
jgi:hypothetical protein